MVLVMQTGKIAKIRHCFFPTTERSRRRASDAGLTLLELMVVMVIVVILAGMSVPTYHTAVIHTREGVLRDDLYTMRKLIDQFTVDKQHPPQALQDLVDQGYLRGGIPNDPFTGRNDTWQAETEDVPISPEAGPGIVDVHSGSDAQSLDGSAYSSW